MKKSRLFGTVCAFVYILFASSPVNAVLLYGLSTDTFNLYKIDTSSLSNPTLVGNIDYGTDLSGLVGPVDGQLYTFDRPSDTLVFLNPSSATVIEDISIDRDMGVQPRGYAISPSGILYVITGGLNSMELYSLDINTGTTTLKTAISGAAGIEAITFAPNGTLYASGSPTAVHPSQTLYTVDITTGISTFLANLTVTDLDSLTYASDGFLYGADSLNGVATDLYRIDPTTGQTFNLGSAGITGFNGITTVDPAVIVPIPPSVWLFGSGLLGLIGIARRKKA